MQAKLPSLIVGITGNIGSGKSTVCKIFELLGIPVYYSDERAKYLMINDLNLVRQIQDLLGQKAYTDTGELDREYVAEVVFNNPDKLAQLNAIVHPAVANDAQQWHQMQENVPYTLQEAALIFEAGSNRYMDAVILVTAPAALRLERVMARDGVEEQSVKARMDKQMAEEEKIKLADYLINNDGKNALIPQVWNLHQQLKSLR